MVQLDIEMHEHALTYVERHFISKDRLAALCGVTTEHLDILLTARCAPGVIYGQETNRHWWSALAALMGTADTCPPKSGIHWYTSGASWWIRRAIMFQSRGNTAAQTAEHNAKYFHEQFQNNIMNNPHAYIAYPSAFARDGSIVTENIKDIAASEWNNWVCGGFAVCLPFFTANTCIRKEVLATRIRLENENKSPHPTPLTSLEVFNLSEELASLILPFAPWERGNGTPGRTIDPFLTSHRLGREFPYT